ncbi:radical SAM protein, partial [Planctomycetota bacterium]
KAESLKAAGLDRLNISLDTLDSARYRELTGGGLIERVLEGIDAALAAGFRNTKLNMVVMPGFNEDEVEPMGVMCRDKGLDLQLIRRFSLTEPKDPEAAKGFHRPPPCGGCNRLRLLADGTLKPCLHADIEVPVDWDDIKGSILKAVSLKPEHGLACAQRQMNQIGG